MPIAMRLWSVGRTLLLLAALGTTFAAAAVVGLRVALRFREVPVPDLTGQSVAAATERLAAEGLTLRVDASRRAHPSVPPDRIAQQDPSAGVSTRRPRAVRVWLKAPARATLVPDLVGNTERTARIRTDEAALMLEVATPVTAPQPAGTVLAQWPPAGMPGDTVRLVVSAGPHAAPVLLPDLVGQEGTAVADALKAEGLRVVLVTRRRTAGTASSTTSSTSSTTTGLIASQQPPAGSPVGPTDTIALEVYR
ncbi:MAG: PASTA domain-containing protein [Vicinamibacterales bacterium]